MKQYILLLLLLSLLLSLTGCGKEREVRYYPDKETVETTNSEPTAQTEETVPAATEPQITIAYPALGAHTVGAVWDESVYQQGEPITPEPGDTQYSFEPARLAEFPADEDCTDVQLLEKWLAVEGLSFADLDARGCDQLILTAAREDGVTTVNTCYQRQSDGTWAAVPGLTRMSGWCGGSGVVHGRARNSGTSPAGLWSLGLAFGNAEKPQGLKLPWRDIGPNSDWVDDPDSIYFNSWQERGDPNLTDTWNYNLAEHLEDYTAPYAYSCVIRFNAPPYVIPERGSAIFLHCGSGTSAGCIALPETDMVAVLLWLDPAENPYILISGYARDL